LDLYIYYRVHAENAAALRQAVVAMQQALAREHGVDATLKRRPEEKDGRQTWMEVYLAVPDGFDAILAQAAERAGLSALIDGARHTEVFVDISSCA
jgi:hypothetical protein